MRSIQTPDDVPTVADQTAIVTSTMADLKIDLVSDGAEETQNLGETIGRLVERGDLLLLQGQIGAGKTCFTQGLARGMGLKARVTSPSFTLANVYQAAPGGSTLYHLDLWRIASAVEALGIGLDEYLTGEGVCVVEWPDVAESVLPSDFLRVHFDVVGDGRRIRIEPVGGARPRELAAKIAQALDRREGSGGARASRD